MLIIILHLFRSSMKLKVYSPENLDESLKNNFSDYCFSYITFDSKTGYVNFPEFIKWQYPDFIENINEYKEFVDIKVCEFINSKKYKKKVVKKYSWKTSFNGITPWKIE